MCVVAIALNAHPQWRVVLAANRDEYHARPSAALARWEGDDAHVIAGRDLLSGGTWLGVSEQGRLAVVTNIRTGSLPDPDKRSRGALIADFLRGQGPFGDLDAFNPFSLFAVDTNSARLVANRPAPILETLADGIHSLSNGLADEPWPRREWLHAALEKWLTGDDAQPEALFGLLADETTPSPNDDHAPIFIRNAAYGTRCSTVVAIDHEGKGRIIERRFGPDGAAHGETASNFTFSMI